MKKLFASILAIFILQATSLAMPVISKDSSAIYITKQQFENDSAAFSCKCFVTEKAWIFWSAFDYEACGRLKLSGKAHEEYWDPGSIYGFFMNDVKYIFLPAQKKYFAVLNDKLPVPLFVKEEWGRHATRNVIVYISPKSGNPTEFNKNNLSRDFASDKELLVKMIELYKQIDKVQYRYLSEKKCFKKCKEITYAYQTDMQVVL